MIEIKFTASLKQRNPIKFDGDQSSQISFDAPASEIVQIVRLLTLSGKAFEVIVREGEGEREKNGNQRRGEIMSDIKNQCNVCENCKFGLFKFVEEHGICQLKVPPKWHLLFSSLTSRQLTCSFWRKRQGKK